MTKDEALRLALETLEYAGPSWIEAKQPAITAIKEALAQPEQDGECKHCTDGCPACDARKLPEQEPVTWRNAAIRVGEDLCSVGPFRYYDMTAEQWLDWALSVVTVHAPPPQRTWVGLTDKEIEEIWKIAMFTDYGIGAELSNQPFVHYAKAIEAKLKEKNGL
jgi:hypothetical protein